MQAVEIDVAQTVPVPAAATRLDVELLNTQGEVSGTGTVEIAAQCTKG